MAEIPKPCSTEPSEQKVNILLVDDNPANLLSLRAILDELGQNIIEAHSGEEAAEQVQAKDFAVVVLDVMMPGINGFETAKLLRADSRFQHTPIIFLTANDVDRSHLEDGYALCAVDFMVKPYLPFVLQAKVRGFVYLFQDKERSKREADQLRLLIHGTTDYAIFMLDQEGHVLTWNLGAERLKGYKAEEIIGQHFSRFYPPEAIDQAWPQHELQVAGREGQFEGEGWRIRKDGSRFWAQVVVSALRDEHGNVRGFSKVTRDLTSRKKADETLRRTEERFKLLVEGAKDYAIFLLDPQGHIASWNIGAERIKQYKAEEIIGKHFSTFYPQESIDRNWPAYELREAEKVGRFEDEGWRVRKDGSQFWANVIITALRDESGKLLGFSKITRDMTERKQAEENARQLLRVEVAREAAEASAREAELARNEERRLRERFYVTLASIGDGVIVTDENSQVTFLNSIAEQLTGWTLREVEGKSLDEIFSIVNEQTRQPTENPVTKALREGRIVGLANHTILIARDGTERAIDDSAAPIREEDGSIIGVILVFRDVSRERKAKNALEDSEERLRLAMEAGRLGSWAWDIPKSSVEWSPTLEKIHGLAPGGFAGTFEAYQRDIHPDDRERVLSVIRQTVEKGHDHYLEYRIVWPDGSVHWLESRGKLFHDENNQPLRLIGVCSDVSERKQLEHSLHFLAEASKSLSLLVDYKSTLQKVARLAVPEFADWCTVDLLEANGSLQRLAAAHVDPAKVELAAELARRYPPASDAPRGPFNVVRTGKAEFLTDIPVTLLQEVAQDDEHLRIIQALGLKSYVCVPLRTNTTLLGVMTFVAAESGRRYFAADVVLAEELAYRAAIAIENARLYQQIREADRRKDEFLAMLAHELRNPLAPLRSGLEIMAMDAGNDQETIGVMQDQVEHIIRLVDDLLDVSRIMRGRVELRREPFEIAALVRRSVLTVQPLVDSHQQQLIVSVPDEPIWVEVDPVRLIQVIENLLNNASKYTDTGGRIELNVKRSDGDVIIEVSDTGIGLEPELLPFVFELFTQSSRSLDRSQGGLGIGLTLVKTLIEMHGGTVTARSAGPGQGSTFTLGLPVIKPPTATLTETDEPIQTRRFHILVVDDNVGAAQMLAMLLTKLNDHHVETVHEGPSALSKIQESHPQIVFLDIGLPGMDGYQVGRAVRSMPEFDDMLLVALTGYGQEEDRKRSREAGFDAHLVKPPSRAQINELLRHPKLLR
jgi:PAS domain S-box-containing protein